MNTNDTFILEGKSYHLIQTEHEIEIPQRVLVTPIWEKDREGSNSYIYEVMERQLYLKDMIVSSDRGFPVINDVIPQSVYSENKMDIALYENLNERLTFSGCILIGSEYSEKYSSKYDLPYYQYARVYELIFEDGKHITTIDHSKAMLRIRKNLDLGLRTMEKERDRKCIKHFLKTSFVGDYWHPGRKKIFKLQNILDYIKKVRG